MLLKDNEEKETEIKKKIKTETESGFETETKLKNTHVVRDSDDYDAARHEAYLISKSNSLAELSSIGPP